MSTGSFDPAAYKAGQRKDWTGAAGGWRKWWKTLEAAFRPVGDRLVQLAAVRAGHHVLDVATGIGEPAVTASLVVGPAGRVVATDLSPGMLEIARERAADLGLGNIEFREMDAEALDLPGGTFDAALCRFGLMFLPDVDRALGGIWRLLVPGGRFAASVWGEPDRVPFLSVTMSTITRELDLPPPLPGAPGLFSLADGDKLASRFEAVGFAELHTETLQVVMEYASLDEYIQFVRDVSAPIKNLLADVTPERKAEVWRAVAEAHEGSVGANGRLRLSGETILVAGRR
jgi:ubiquinone/menaquinone biosynthesis C-methylase UbiE